MLFHPEAEKAFNRRAFELVGLVEESEIKSEPQNISGSWANRIPLDWSSKLDITQAQIINDTNYANSHSSIYEVFQGKAIGYGLEKYLEFEKFVEKVYEVKNISKRISFNFLYNSTFKWLLNTHVNKKADSDYCNYISSRINEVLKNYKFHFEILHLDIEKSFKIGNVEFEFITPEFIDKYMVAKGGENSEIVKKTFQGHVYISYEVLGAEKERAEEVAYEECVKGMDVFKLFSPTIFTPDYPLNFEIDKRVNLHQQSSLIIRNLNDDKDFSINMSSQCKPITFGINAIDDIQRNMRNFSNLICLPEPNELQQLIINSLNRFSEAISNKNIHKRIVDIFTIWESLLLKDSNVPIMDTVSTYASKLLKKSIEDRKTFIGFLKQMYEIRSAMIHHAKFKKIDLKAVAEFQIATINLMEILILQSQKHQSKQSLLEEIDNAIYSAY